MLDCELDLFTVFPAHAGVILEENARQYSKTRFSRTRGGDPSEDQTVKVAGKFFPHTRG